MMRRLTSFALSMMFCLSVCACYEPEAETPTRGKMRMPVSESHAWLLEKEAQAFERLYPEADITIVPMTTREAIVELLNDSTGVICVDRALNVEEQAAAQTAGLRITDTKIAQDALAIIVHAQNPVQNLALGTLAEVVAGQKTSWKELAGSKGLGRIEVALTGRNSGVYELLVLHFLRLSQEPAVAFVAKTQREVVQYVSTHPAAIGAVSVAALQDSIPNVRALALAPTDTTVKQPFVKLHQANIYRGWYPLHYPVYTFMTAELGSLASGFTAFVARAPGQKIILDAKLVPATMPVRLVQLTEN
ncbi:MAG: PstS family phosphate ABC transporter substrate-binding protein [bacterium]